MRGTVWDSGRLRKWKWYLMVNHQVKLDVNIFVCVQEGEGEGWEGLVLCSVLLFKLMTKGTKTAQVDLKNKVVLVNDNLVDENGTLFVCVCVQRGGGWDLSFDFDYWNEGPKECSGQQTHTHTYIHT